MYPLTLQHNNNIIFISFPWLRTRHRDDRRPVYRWISILLLSTTYHCNRWPCEIRVRLFYYYRAPNEWSIVSDFIGSMESKNKIAMTKIVSRAKCGEIGSVLLFAFVWESKIRLMRVTEWLDLIYIKKYFSFFLYLIYRHLCYECSVV